MLARAGSIPTRGDWTFEVKWDGFRAIVSTGRDGAPDFPLLCERMLMRRPGIAVTYMVFDLLSVHGESLLRAPYSERRTQLEALNLNSVHWQTPVRFDDGEALFEAVCEQELEGIVAKRVDGRYMPGYRAGRKSRIEGTGVTSSSASRRSTSAAHARSSSGCHPQALTRTACPARRQISGHPQR
jgi:ATP-dependent DNA ligase